MSDLRDLKPPETPAGSTSAAAVTRLRVEGMTCGNCARKVLDALQAVPGVTSADVQVETGTAAVRWQPGIAMETDPLLAAVRRAGFRPRLQDPAAANATPTPSPAAAWRFNVLFGGALTLPLLFADWVLGLGDDLAFRWLGFAFAAPVVVGCGRQFFVGAWRQLRRGASNMDTLVALGSSTAFGYSTWALLAGVPGHVYFLEAAAIITLISAGHWLEAIASARAAGALRALMNLAPPTARRLDAAGAETDVPVASLQRGDRILLRPGDRVPTDGTIADGASAVDESMLTGESLPVEKSIGDPVFAGTINRQGRLVMAVEATGESTALAHIIAVVQRAQNSRARIQRLGDRVSSVFVPIVVFIALGTGLWWGLDYASAREWSERLLAFLPHAHLPETALAAAFIHAAAVLIVACPCAMGLATPVAIMAGTNVAAREGILVRDGQALEKSGTLTLVLFDKTGTLTRGQATVTASLDVRPESQRAESLAVLARALAGSSQHPLSQATSAWAGQVEPGADPLPVYAWQEVRGQGVQASWSGDALRLGAPRWLAECGVDLTPAAAFVAEWSRQGATILALARDRTLVGVIALRDEPKPGARAVVDALTRRGLKVGLITGDHAPTAAAIADQTGISSGLVFAEVRPEQKSEIVGRLQSQGERVAFVGDGINDAPALEQADLGIAVSRASDVAREAADLILLRSELPAIPQALDLAQATLRTIRQNLFWAFFYNAAAIPLAAVGGMSPILCAAAMGVSDLFVIGNALRLYRWRPPRSADRTR